MHPKEYFYQVRRNWNQLVHHTEQNFKPIITLHNSGKSNTWYFSTEIIRKRHSSVSITAPEDCKMINKNCSLATEGEKQRFFFSAVPIKYNCSNKREFCCNTNNPWTFFRESSYLQLWKLFAANTSLNKLKEPRKFFQPKNYANMTLYQKFKQIALRTWWIIN